MGERSSVVGKVEAMKKAGFSPWMILLVTLASTPGLWEKFIDNDDDVALETIENFHH